MKKRRKNSRVQRIALCGMGIALFVVCTLCLQVPVFENYYLCLGYIVMAVYCWSVGTAEGILTGTLGVILYCILTGGLRGMPGWAAGNVVIGLGLGVIVRALKRYDIRDKKTVLGTGAVLVTAGIGLVIVTAAGILGVKSLVEHLLYTQPMWVRVAKNVYAFAADAFVLVLSLPLCRLLAPPDAPRKEMQKV